MDLGFAGNALAEGLVVSMCLGGALVGCLFSGLIADGIGRCRAFQLAALPMIAGACISASTTSLEGMLFGRFLVGTGMGVGPPVASLYVTEVSPPSVRGTYGSFIQIATCLGLIASLFIGIPVKEVLGWWTFSPLSKDSMLGVVEVSTSKTGKHGHAKCHFVGIDIFTAKKLEDIVPSSHNCDAPHVTRTDYQLIDISEDGFVSLLTESGNTKDDLRLPTDETLLAQIKDGFAEGKDLVVSVMSAMGEEQICALKDIGPK